jgi:hypothetical protein
MDELKKQITEIKTILTDKQPASQLAQSGPPTFTPNVSKTPGMHIGSDIMAALNVMGSTCAANGETGRVTYMGVFKSSGQQSTWVQNEINTDDLLHLVENRMAEKVLNCIGNNDRLNILLALLKEPMTVAELVEKRGYNSTGQVYHHLKPLLMADIIAEEKSAGKGKYFVRPHRVQGIIMLLAGIHDMVDIEYSRGEWGAETEIHPGATMVDERYMTTNDENQKIIHTYFSSLNPLVLKAFPPKQKKKLVILRVIAQAFEPGRRYGSKELNRILKPIYEDHATIRRYLIEYGFMERTADGGEYWLKNI